MALSHISVFHEHFHHLCLYLFGEIGAGYAPMHEHADTPPPQDGTTAFVYHLSRPLQTPAMQ